MIKVIKGVLATLVTLPIWLYLLYKVLETNGASDLMWFLYWVYLPASFVVHAIMSIEDKK